MNVFLNSLLNRALENYVQLNEKQPTPSIAGMMNLCVSIYFAHTFLHYHAKYNEPNEQESNHHAFTANEISRITTQHYRACNQYILSRNFAMLRQELARWDLEIKKNLHALYELTGAWSDEQSKLKTGGSQFDFNLRMPKFAWAVQVDITT